MTLTRFTISDRVAIVDLLKLPESELEEGSRLYRELVRIEDRDARITGLNRVTYIKDLISQVQAVESELETIENSINYGAETISVPDEITIRYGARNGLNAGLTGGKESRKSSLLVKLKTALNFPWEHLDRLYMRGDRLNLF